MSRSSRFEKLEGERRPSGESSSGATLDRFGDTPRATAPQSATAPSSAQLERFVADGTEALRTIDDELSELPFLECPRCSAHAGKYETSCHHCGTRLDTHEARQHNLPRLQALRAEREEASARKAERLEEEIAETLQQRAERRAALDEELQAIKKQYGGQRNELARYAGVWLAIVVVSVLAMELSGVGRVFFGAVALGLLLSRLPLSAWRLLGRPIRHRWW